LLSARILVAAVPALWRLALALAVLLPAGCGGTGPVYPTSDRLDPWVSTPAAVDPASDRAPAISGQVARCRLDPGQRRSALRAGGKWGPGETYLLGFDIRAMPGPLPARPVTISRLLRLGVPPGTPAVEIAAVRLDARNGVTVMGRSCIPAAQLGTWHSVELRVALADDDTGFLEAFCTRRPVWARDALRTTQPPTCRRAEGCTTPAPRPARFEWQLGLIADAPLSRPAAIEMQRIFFHRLFVIPNRVGNL